MNTYEQQLVSKRVGAAVDAARQAFRFGRSAAGKTKRMQRYGLRPVNPSVNAGRHVSSGKSSLAVQARAERGIATDYARLAAREAAGPAALGAGVLGGGAVVAEGYRRRDTNS